MIPNSTLLGKMEDFGPENWQCQKHDVHFSRHMLNSAQMI